MGFPTSSFLEFLLFPSVTDGQREAMAGYGRYLLQHCVYICIIGIRTVFWTKGVAMLRCRHGSNYLALSPEWTTGTGRNAQTSKLPLHQPFSLPSSSRDTINCLGQCSSNAQLSPLQGAPLLEPLLLVHFPLPSSAAKRNMR